MQSIFKKYFWVIGAVAIMACAFLAASAANHVIEGKFLSDSAKPSRVKPVKRARKPVEQRSKVGEPLASRNIFCSDCQPVETEATPAAGSDPNSIPMTSLPLELVATNVGSKPGLSFATIRNTQSDSQGAYWNEQVIPGAGKVVQIGGKHVDFENQATKRRERISLLAKGSTRPKTAAKPSPKKPTRRGGKNDELTAMIDEGVKKVDDFTYEIDRGLVDKVLSNPMSVARGARIVPSVKNGKANGFKLYAIRPSSVYAKIGLRNGDTIHSINGFDLTTPDKALEVYTKVKEASNLSVTATRRGKPVSLSYTIR